MQDIDYNWQALKEEDRTLPEKQPHSMRNAETVQIVQWHNNPKQQKITWRETMSPYAAWIDKGDAKGMWREQENRLYEEIQYELRNSYGYKVLRSTARFEDGTSMLNVKTIEIHQDNEIKEVILILDGSRVYTGKQGKVKNGIRWSFTNGVNIKELL